jgi:hypothetical protein
MEGSGKGSTEKGKEGRAYGEIVWEARVAQEMLDIFGNFKQ